jgi:hypothetical protein
LSTHLRLGLPSGLFPSGFPTNILHAFLGLPHSCYMPCPFYLPIVKLLGIYGLITYSISSFTVCKMVGPAPLSLSHFLTTNMVIDKRCWCNRMINLISWCTVWKVWKIIGMVFKMAPWPFLSLVPFVLPFVWFCTRIYFNVCQLIFFYYNFIV